MRSYFIMTVDVDPPFSSKQNYVIEKGVAHLLNLFDEHFIKATFFVPGIVAEKFPEITEKIAKRKHEIACHGLKHAPSEATLNVDKQTQIISTATKIIESITGFRPVGFRAPLFKINKDCWIALSKNRYLYDSSLVFSPIFGNYKTPFQSKPFFLANSKLNKDCGLLEIPVSVNPFLFLPLGGGWLRIFGLRWAKIGIKINFTFQLPIVFYIHPKDVIDMNTYGLSWYMCLNTSSCLKILGEIIRYVKRSGGQFITAYELACSFFDMDNMHMHLEHY
jgi:hypothetical protein